MALDGTYTGLKASVADFLNRSDLTASIPDFIVLAEAQMARRFISRIKQGMDFPRRLVAKDTISIASSAEFASVPSDFMGPLELILDGSPIIELAYLENANLQHEKAKNCWSGAPKWYTVDGSQIQLYPVADQAYTAELTYISRVPALSVTPTNWILTDHPDAYLYGALTASAPYLKDDGRTEMWGTLFTTAIDDICNSDPMPTEKAILRSGIPRARAYRWSGWDISTDT